MNTIAKLLKRLLKLIDIKKMIRYKVIKKLKTIAKNYKLKVRFVDKIEFGGEYWVENGIAIVSRNEPIKTLISTFFHELGHHLDYNDGLFKSFYNPYSPLYKMRQVALRAELHTDRRGEKLCKKYFPKLKYERSYRTRQDLDFLEYYYRDGRRKY